MAPEPARICATSDPIRISWRSSPTGKCTRIFCAARTSFKLNWSFARARADAIDMPDASTDLVFCSLVRCTVDRPVDVIAEVRSCATAGALFALITFDCQGASPTLHARRFLERPWRWMFEDCICVVTPGQCFRPQVSPTSNWSPSGCLPSSFPLRIKCRPFARANSSPALLAPLSSRVLFLAGWLARS